MIAVDTNILVYAHREESPFHYDADRALTELAQGSTPWAVPWPCLSEFLAIITNPRIYRGGTPTELALTEIDNWFESPNFSLIAELPGGWNTFRDTVLKSKIRGGAMHDARIASICLQHGVDQLWSADRDFSRFPGLRVVNPLVAR